MKNKQKPIAGCNTALALRPRSLTILLAVCLAAFLGTGCKSTEKSHPDHLASVEIHGHPVERVRDVTSQVFLENGYRVTLNGWAKLVFEKEGSNMNNIAYGNWMGSGIWIRVKASIFETSPGNCRLDCDAFLLRNRNEPVEEEIKISKLHNRPYQKLLNEVVKRLARETVKPN